MAKQRTIGDIVPEVPAAVQEAADAYVSAKRSLGKAKEKHNTAQDALIEAMRAADCLEVPIDLGNKRIVLNEKDVLRIKKIKKDKMEDSDDDDDDEEEEADEE